MQTLRAWPACFKLAGRFPTPPHGLFPAGRWQRWKPSDCRDSAASCEEKASQTSHGVLRNAALRTAFRSASPLIWRIFWVHIQTTKPGITCRKHFGPPSHPIPIRKGHPKHVALGKSRRSNKNAKPQIASWSPPYVWLVFSKGTMVLKLSWREINGSLRGARYCFLTDTPMILLPERMPRPWRAAGRKLLGSTPCCESTSRTG